MRNHGLATTALLLIASPAIAANWTVDAARSTLTFEGSQSGEPFHGSFTRFTPEIDFSEADPQKGKIHVTVDLASVTADTKDQSQALPTKEWFDVKAFPKAEFTSTSILRTGEHAYAVAGDLTLKGIKKAVTIPFNLRPEAEKMHAKGEFKLSRSDFKVGTGEWEKDTYIAYPVAVKFDLIATQNTK